MQGITFGIPQVLRKTLFGMVVYFTGCLWNTVPGMVYDMPFGLYEAFGICVVQPFGVPEVLGFLGVDTRCFSEFWCQLFQVVFWVQEVDFKS